jgi:flagellar M-ring protein FliF
MENIKTKLNGAKEGWSKISTKKKITMVILIASIALFGYLYSNFINKSDYVTLFTNMDFADAGNIVNDLEVKGIEYQLEENGTKILIPEDRVDKYRLQLAMDGNLPENSKGFEIFDDMGLMVTEDDRKIMYQRALAGELQRSIMSLDSINSAKVNLVMSEKSIFETEQKPASASIVIDIKANKKVDDSMVRGIAALVSGAVGNLPDENIKIIDSKGSLLSGVLSNKDDLNTLDVVNQHQKVKKDFEIEVEKNLNELLGSAFGRDKIKVSVFADLDFDSQEVTNIEYKDPVIRSEQIDVSGNSINSEALTSGLVGDNTSNVFEGGEGEGDQNYSRTTNNEVSTETTTIIKAPGKVNKISTSVVFDGTLSDDRSNAIQNIVRTATGFDQARGDEITVEGVLFDRTYETKVQEELEAIRMEEEANKTFLDKYGEYLIFGLIAAFGIIILGSLISLLSKKKKVEELPLEPAPAYNASVNIKVDDMEDIMEDKIEVKPDKKKNKAQDYAKENPQLAADLIKAWMKD